MPGASKRRLSIHMEPCQHSTYQLPQISRIWMLLTMMHIWGETESFGGILCWWLYHNPYLPLPPNPHTKGNKIWKTNPGPLLWGTQIKWRSAKRHKNQMAPPRIHLVRIRKMATCQQLTRNDSQLSIRHVPNWMTYNIPVIPNHRGLNLHQWVLKRANILTKEDHRNMVR